MQFKNIELQYYPIKLEVKQGKNFNTDFLTFLAETLEQEGSYNIGTYPKHLLKTFKLSGKMMLIISKIIEYL